MKTKNSILILFACTSLSCISMLALFKSSQNKLLYRNSLTRIFPPGLAELSSIAELKFNSYYFAGSANGDLYLGNSTAPLLVTVLDSALSLKSLHRISIEKQVSGMTSPKIRIDPPYFYVYEGSISYIYQGSVSNWQAELKINSGNYFSQLQPISKTQVVARFTDAGATKNSIGMTDLKTSKCRQFPDYLSDGNLFSTDGMLLFDRYGLKIAYVHYYSNKVLIADSNMKRLLVSKTIDTLDSPKLKITAVKNQRTFSEMPILANRLAHFDSGCLYVNSQIMGHNEPKEKWDTSSIIDLFESTRGGYLGSFYIDDINGKKVKSFWVDRDNLYALGGSKIMHYKLRKFLTQ